MEKNWLYSPSPLTAKCCLLKQCSPIGIYTSIGCIQRNGLMKTEKMKFTEGHTTEILLCLCLSLKEHLCENTYSSHTYIFNNAISLTPSLESCGMCLLSNFSITGTSMKGKVSLFT